MALCFTSYRTLKPPAGGEWNSCRPVFAERIGSDEHAHAEYARSFAFQIKEISLTQIKTQTSTLMPSKRRRKNS